MELSLVKMESSLETSTTPLSVQRESFNLFEDGEGYINNRNLYYSYFHTIPSIQAITNLNMNKAKKWIEVAFKQQIIKVHSKEVYNIKRKLMKHQDLFFILKNRLVINLYINWVDVLFEEENRKQSEEIIRDLKKFTFRNRKRNDISLITSGPLGLSTTEIKINKPKLNLKTHYNDDLLPLHDIVLKNLKQKDKSSLFLFHGTPGTGKSTYLRYLIHHLNKEVIFMPPKLASNLDQPDFTSFIISNSNSLFIIEDAEELITSRQGNRNSKISMLLNLTDGLLGEALGIQIIATFNTNVFNIDKALLRKGRLTGIYEFKPLSVKKSISLLQSIGVKELTTSTPMTLSEIYNTDSRAYNYKSEKTTIGFMNN